MIESPRLAASVVRCKHVKDTFFHRAPLLCCDKFSELLTASQLDPESLQPRKVKGVKHRG